MQFIKSSPKHRKTGASLRYYLLAMLSAALFVVSLGSAGPTKAALIPNTDYLQLTLNTSTYTTIPETKGPAQAAGGIAVSGNYKIEYAWTTSKTPANGDFVALTDASQYGGTDTTSKLRFIPTPTRSFGINTDVTLTLRKADASAKLYGFHGWLPSKSTNDGIALSDLPAAPDDRASITNLFTEFASFGTFSDLTDLRYAFANTSSSFEVKPELPSTVKNLTALFAGSFYNQPEVSSWNVSNVTSMSSMFAGRSDTALGRNEFNQDISAWDVSAVTNMSSMFRWSKFNGNISSWSTTSLVNTQMMFMGAINFNGQLGSWDVSKVTNFSYMFAGPSTFNQPLNSWNTSAATNFSYMFLSNTVFNQPLNQWSTNNGTNFSYMFSGATLFNQPLNQWSTNNGTNFSYMFSGATAFNQELQAWNMVRANNLSYMFSGASNFNNGETYSTSASGSKPLNWNTVSVLNVDSMFMGATKFNQSLDGWNLSNLSLPNGSTSNMDNVFNGATGFNNGDAQGESGVMDWTLSGYNSSRNMYGFFRNASSFNQDTSAWQLWGQRNGQYLITGATRFDKPIGHFRLSSLILPYDAPLSFEAISQSNYEKSIVDWAYGPEPTNVGLSYFDLKTRLSKYSTCLSKAAYTKLNVTNTRKAYALNAATGTEPSNCVDHSISWPALTPFAAPRAVAGQTGVYQITPSSVATSLNSGEIKYMVYNRDPGADCEINPSTGVVTFKVLAKTCAVRAVTTSSDSQELSFVQKEFTTVAPATYTVTYSYNLATSGNSTTSTVWRTGDPAITLPTPERTNFTFDAWYSASNFASTPLGATFTPTANTSLYARFVSVITFEPQNGASATVVRVEAGNTVLAPGSPLVSRAGYSLGDWYSDTTYSTKVATKGAGFTATGNATLYAKWTANTLNVTYNQNGGSGASGSATTKTGETLSEPTPPTRTGYTFNGWFSDSSLTTSISSWPWTHGATASFSIYAGWTANTLTITYSTNGGSSISTGSTVTGASISSAPTAPTRVGYTFVGWFSDIGLNNAVTWPYAHAKTANFTLYAKWTANPLVVTYVSNGGTAVTDGSTVTAGTITSAPTAPTRSGYNFLGWYTDALFTTAVTWPFSHGQTSDFSLYAKWISRTQTPLNWTSATTVPYQGSLTLSVSGGSGTGAISYTRSINSTCTLSGSTLTPGHGGSECVITATKAGDGDFDSVSTAPQTITITKISQSPLALTVAETVTWASNPPRATLTYRVGGSLTLQTTGGSGTGQVVYALTNDSECSIVNTTLLIPDVGRPCKVTATKGSDGDYSSEDSPTVWIITQRAQQVPLVWKSQNGLTYGQSFEVSYAGGSGNGALVITSQDTSACTVSGRTITGVSVGSCNVLVELGASTNYHPAWVLQTVSVGPASQTVSFTSQIPATPLAGGTYNVTATSTSGASPTFSIDSGSCSVSGGQVTFASSGDCVIRASATRSNYSDASKTQTISVGQRNQTLSFASDVQNMASKTYGAPVFFADASTTEATLTPSYALGSGTTNSACSVSTSGIVQLLAAGICEIEVSQAGSAAVAAASSISKTFTVLPDQASQPYITSVSAGHQSITAAFIKPSYSGGSPITAYRVDAVFAGGVESTSACSVDAGSTQTCTISGLTNGTSYQVKVAAITLAGAGIFSDLAAARVPATNPAAVSAFTAVPDNTTIALSWENPISLGGGTFDSYRIFYKRSSVSSYPTSYINVQSQTPKNYTITGLINGESYDVKIVTVTTANTASLTSNTAEVKETPRTVPDAPATVDVLEVAGKVVITWSAPQSDGGNPVNEYRVTINGSTCSLANALDNLCEITAPTSSGTYPIEVKAKNDAGYSSPATATFTKAGVPSSGGGSSTPGGTESAPNGAKAIQILTVSIKSLISSGGQVVSVTGKNFTGVTTVLVGGVKAKIISVKDGLIKFIAPRNTDGPATLTVKSPTASAEVVDAFTYSKGIAKVKVAWVLGFVQANTTIKAADKAKLRSALQKSTGTVAVTCVGYQSYSYNTAKDAQTAMGRAKQACNYLKSVNPKLTVKSVIARTTLKGTASRKLAVQFKTSK